MFDHFHSIVSFVASEIQSFSVPPTDTEVVEGQSVILTCQVSNLVGHIQWSKNGELLGGACRGQESITAKAHVTVLLPPTSIQIVDKLNGSVAQFTASTRISECELRWQTCSPKLAG
ncbi:hypothetical protein CEXT_697911 [Caerostris extrusa]|uniref:Ig-like domain-containing protein n=1 Tax=Caerostris extrusa TaxID=172846 RepID=A0AAV4N8H4_CAEEX|nr:hypothetical protein CEXT_697911 [Caerostris extrusa]